MSCLVSGRFYPSHWRGPNDQTLGHKDGLDREVVQWDREGDQRESWGAGALRVTDLVATPNFTHLVVIGMDYVAPYTVTGTPTHPGVSTYGSSEVPLNAAPTTLKKTDNWMVIYNLATKQANPHDSIK
ncbi:hypothetical protein PLEOSDRAFT_164753 [Pleurotus ostreatus PC15]|uniref:Uncharacterized protein n=1 Tax=Pleurotus ostreatus (strain PC15) TaxID=1137138 RepID=A0A067P957_PLEO1|nr:hypothetical protein PLEOSDRAFT_164753 [Pleurotus ostreatus PC15]